jgi:prepilin-type N-terminal cleavage/methylation domain-containing protein
VNRKAFTLIELLMVILIMGILGSITVGGYRAMQRGMEERGVMENVNHFIRSAYRRAQIDRQQVAVYYWNELLRAETENDTLIVVGKAVAVRRAGRISRVTGQYLFDEFADLDKERLIVDYNDLESENSDSGSTDKDNLMPIYKMNSQSGTGRSLVSQTTKNVTAMNSDRLLSVMQVREIPCYAYVLNDPGTAGNWQTGDAYGFEFAEIQLPHGYIFGSSYPKQAGGRPEVKMLWFDVSLNSGSGSDQGASGTSTLQVYSLRPGESGQLEAQVVATSDKPTEGIH